MAAKWHLPDEEYTSHANDLLAQFARHEVVLIAPDVIFLEVASAIASAAIGRNERISVEEGEIEVAAFLDMEFEVYSSADLALAAFRLVHQHGCALYDAIYLALALRLRISFITADRRLYRRVDNMPQVLWLGDESSIR